MTNTKKLTELFRAISATDFDSAAKIAGQICDIEDQKGHKSVARILRGAMAANGISKKRASPSAVNNASFLSSAILRLHDGPSLSDVTLAPLARQELQLVLTEWKKRDKLHERGLSPRSKLLFHGPPGCGKSITAKAIAKELHIPIYLVRFDSIIGAYLGQTAIHLRQLFNFAETSECVLLLDEIDALGKQRGNPLDVGELDRIVIALLQELEHAKPQGIIVATSNLAKNLDDALWRRFDLSLSFKAPNRSSLLEFSRNVAQKYEVPLTKSMMQKLAASKSYASAEGVIIGEARRRVISGE